MKKSMNNALNAARNIILNATMSELEMALHMAQYGVEDKDSIAEKDTEELVFYGVVDWADQDFLSDYEREYFAMEYVPSKGWTRKQVRRGHVLKDKAKHGYHLPRRWDFREYNRGDMEKLKEEAVIKANIQMLSEDKDDEAPISDGVSVLWGVYMENIDKSLKSVKDSEFVFTAKWAAKKCWVKVQNMMVDFYDTIDSVYPEEGMGWKNDVVNEFMDELYNYIKGTRNTAIRSAKATEKTAIQRQKIKLQRQMDDLKRKLEIIDNDRSEDEEI